jgi:ABC-2 type transport system ATP-binding protein
VIEVHDLVKHYGSKEAVRGVTFTARPGEITGYLGPNGAGKSTTVKILAGLLRPTSGQVRICGYDLSQDSLEIKRRLGYVPDSAALYTSLTPNEYLSLIAELYHLDRAVGAERIATSLKAFEIDDAADRHIETLSKGQRQKVLLCAALLHDPDVILLDEPLNGLDVNAALTFRQLLNSLVSRGKTILFCSHILEVIERICAHVVVIHHGEIVADDQTARLLAGNPKGTLEAVFQALTRREDADEGANAWLAAFDGDKSKKKRR